jgi:hypothetical protein
MDMYGGLKKAVMFFLKKISQAEENHDELEITCVVIEIRFRQVHRTNASEMFG